MNLRNLSMLIIALGLASCSPERTYVLVTVDTDPGLEGQVTQLRFTSELKREDTVLSTDERSFPDSPRVLAFPNSFVIVADKRGKDGEVVEIYVEAIDNSGDIIARSRGVAPVVPDKETSVQVTLGSPCTRTEDCLAGQDFCSAPATCDCEGAACERGYCRAIPEDDGNTCTVFECNEDGQTAEHIPLNDGTECEGVGGVTLTCAGGLCGCGDGITSPDIEECDEGDANANEPNRCRSIPACTLPQCGDEIVDGEEPFNEECDQGASNSFAPNACRPNCKEPTCGDFIVDEGEECDEGDPQQGGLNSDTQPLACRTDCTLPSCGDGVIDAGGFAFGVFFDEECDDAGGNSNSLAGACRQEVITENGTGIRLECRRGFCGDNVVDTGLGERCDDNNTANNDGCNPTCSLEGIVTLVAGLPNGVGNVSGIGADGRLRFVHSIAADSEYAYFTTERGDNLILGRNRSVRRINLASAEVETFVGHDAYGGTVDGVGTEARFSSPRGLALDGTYLYIADSENHVVRRANLQTGVTETIAGTGARGSQDGDISVATLNTPTHVAVASATEILVMDAGDAAGGCFLRKVDTVTNQVSTIAGNNDFGCLFPWDDTGTLAAFGTVSGITMASGDLYVADTNTIRRMNLATGSISTVAGTVFFPGTDDGNPGTVATLGDMARIATGDDELYIADESNGSVRRMDLTTTAITTIPDDGSFTSPRALSVSGTTLLLAEFDESIVHSADLAVPTLTPSLLAGSPSSSGGLVNDQGSSARFSVPQSLALLADVLFVADFGNDAIRAIDLLSSNAVSTLANVSTITGLTSGACPELPGGCLYASTRNGGDEDLVVLNPGTGSEIKRATLGPGQNFGVAVVGGFAYVAVPSENIIRRIDIQQSPPVPDIEPYAGKPGQQGSGDGTRQTALFNAPFGVVECGGALFISETGNDPRFTTNAHVIRRIDLTTELVTTVAGSGGIAGSQDGSGTNARFDAPEALACEPPRPGFPGNLYVADRGGDVVRQIELDTLRVTTLVGAPYEQGVRDGSDGFARMSSPRGLIFDAVSGDLFVTDAVGNVVRRIQ